ncbi:CocE/NonD family hydrolase [candidate division KSB1 bacterium]|nr:CocE/NonD family hydrolase [candidate division KSB1 bacterium]
MTHIMSKNHRLRIIFLLIATIFMCRCRPDGKKNADRISEFGKYKGFSEEKYNGWKRTSKYIAMDDGVKLACDVIRPQKDGLVESVPLPAVWTYYRYHRARENDGKVLSLVDRLPSLQTLIKHGYVIVVVDARGTGASFGNASNGPYTLRVARDTYQCTEWIAGQVWCDGNVGMSGHSYSGIMQFLASAQAPPHLKAVFPSGASFDTYETIYPGGVFMEDFAREINQSLLYWDIEADAVPVDSDSNGQLLKKARLEHRKNADPYDFFKALPYRDSRYNDYPFWLRGNPMIYLNACNENKIPVYQWIGWKDFLIRDAFQWYVNLKSPKKLTVGWWSHDIRRSYELLAIEQLRWFDYWLKGINNGIMEESPVFYTFADDSSTWNQAKKWPLPAAQYREFYFASSDSVDPQADRKFLLSEKSDQGEGWKTEIPFTDSHELVFTTIPLEQDLYVVGHPVVTLNLTTIAKDLDIYIDLYETDESKNKSQVTNGILRASHRGTSTPTFNNMELPYQSHFGKNIKFLTSEESVDMIFDLLPVAQCFEAGHCLSVSVKYENIILPEGLPAERLNNAVSGMNLSKSKIVIPVLKP